MGTSSTELARLAPALATSVVLVGGQTATPEGHLVYDKTKTPEWLARVLDAQARPKVADCTDQDLLVLLLAGFQKAALNLGHDRSMMDQTKANAYAREVLAILRQRWHYLTIGEVEEVFRLGSLAQLAPPPDRDGRPTEEVIYLSPKTVAVWLSRYKYQVKTEAMVYAQRLAYQSSELPHHHPVHAAWRIARLQALADLPAEELRQLPMSSGDPKNLLYGWLKYAGALALGPQKPARFWQWLRGVEARRLQRAGQLPLTWFAVIDPPPSKFSDRLDAACRWRVLRLWLSSYRNRGLRLAEVLWPLADAVYLHHATNAQRAAFHHA